MSFEDYVDEFKLVQEKNLKASSTNLSKFECSLSKGILNINKAIVTTMGLDKNPYVEVYTGVQQGATIFGIKGVDKGSNNALKVKVLKTKPTKINLARLLLKFNLSTGKDYKLDLIDCGRDFLVFAVIAPAPKREAEPEVEIHKEEKKYYGSGISGAQEMVLEGSDF